jgi:hypothetical protein
MTEIMGRWAQSSACYFGMAGGPSPPTPMYKGVKIKIKFKTSFP